MVEIAGELVQPLLEIQNEEKLEDEKVSMIPP